MKLFHSDPVSFQATSVKNQILLENQYIRCVHDLEHGGELSEAIIKNGSGKNLFAQAQSTIVGIIENGTYHCYRSANCTQTECMIFERNGNPLLEFRCALADDSGEILDGLEMLHQVEYTRWGEALHRVELIAAKRIENLGMLQIGTLWPVKSMNCLAVQDAYIQAPYAYAANNVKSWIPLFSGKARSDAEAYLSRWLPVSMLVFRRGVEGFQFTLGDQLAQWDSIGGTLPGFQMGFFAYRQDCDSYEMRFSALDCRREGQFLEGKNVFEFSLAFPFVREKVVPLSPCASNILFPARGLEQRWPTDDDLKRLKDAGTTLMRLHNDGNSLNDGIFWRDAAYPPYPPQEMAKMDDMLSRAHKHGISVVPYFSLHEYHPEAAGFPEFAEEWGRIAAEGDRIIPSFGPNGYFGYQMCLSSGWMQKRKDTIDEVLRNHDFDGLYFDWCVGLECLNPKHGPRHRDFRKLLELLEWSHQRAGRDGELYLHLTYNPNIAAENMATLVLTEECAFSSFSGDMFTPHAHFMNIAPRQVCDMLPSTASREDRLRYAMCALLNHASVSSNQPAYSDFYRENAILLKECTDYARHSAPGEGCCTSSNPKVGMSAYWNNTRNMLLFANLSDAEETTNYSFDSPSSTPLQGQIMLPPLSLKVLQSQ